MEMNDNYRDKVHTECENCRYYYIARFHMSNGVTTMPFCDKHKTNVNKSGTCDAWTEKKE